MTDKELIEDNLAVVVERAPDLTTRFYGNLFRYHPELQRLFGRRSAAAQEKMLLEAILAVVEHMDDPVWLRNTLRPLGAKHVSYGVTAPMYPIVAETLILTLGEASGSAWNAVVEAAWLRAILAVANEMLAGAREVEEADAAPTSRTFAPPSSQQ